MGELDASRVRLLSTLARHAATAEEDARDRFARLLALRWDANAANDRFVEAMNEAIVSAARDAGHGKVKTVKAAEKAAPEVVEAVREKWKARATELVARWRSIDDRRDRALVELAHEIEPRPCPGTWTVAEAVSSSSYSTQGGGSLTYAGVRADLYAEDYRSHGLTVRVTHEDREVKGSGTFGRHGAIRSFRVEVEATRIDCEIARRRTVPGRDDLVEFVRGAWARGANARVFLPGLPWGFEEKHGISFFASIRSG